MIVVGGQDGSDQDASDGQGVNIRLIQSRGFGFGAVFLSPVLRSRLPFVSHLWVFTLKYGIVWITINCEFFILYLGTYCKNPVKSRLERNIHHDGK